MASFSMATKPIIERPSHSIDEDAVDLSETVDISAPGPTTHRPRKNTSTVERGGDVQSHSTYELHAFRPQDRIRRPSAVRLESSATMSFKEGALTEPPTPAFDKGVDPTKNLHCDTTSVPPTRIFSATAIEQPEGDAVTAKEHERNSRIQFAALCWCFFLQGWNDGTTGPLLPVMQEHYRIGFAVVSCLFVFACVGFVLGAAANVWLDYRMGFGKTIAIGSLFQVAAYSLDSPAPPFPVIVFAYCLAGFGSALQNAQANGFVGSLKKHQTTKLNMLHAGYGVGAFVAPLVSTKFSEHRHWSYHYFISAGIAVSNTVVLCSVFRGRRQEDLLAEAGQERNEGEDSLAAGHNIYHTIFGIRSVHFMAIFALIYIGTEVTIGGWIVTFIINERGGGKTAGYVSSGFFGGLTLGRLVLIWVSKKVGEHRVVFLYTFIAIGLELTIWFVPSIIENAVAVSFIGMLLGPMYPILVGHASRILPSWLLTGCVGWITGIGTSGSAVFPFVTGLLASKYGIRSLQPLIVCMMCAMVGLWALIPRVPRRLE